MANLGFCRCCAGRVSDEAHTCPHCGQPDPHLSLSTEDDLNLSTADGWVVEVREMLLQGKKINAYNAIRKGTGLGLAEARSIVENLPPPENTSLPQLIQAICDKAAGKG